MRRGDLRVGDGEEEFDSRGGDEGEGGGEWKGAEFECGGWEWGEERGGLYRVTATFD